MIVMIELSIPGHGVFQLEHLVSDVNGTLALDGQLIDGVAKRIASLRDRLTVHLLTADTHGKQAVIDEQLGLQAVRIPPGAESKRKADYVESLGSAKVVAFGQGANDAGMLERAALGICILSTEGAASASLVASDLIMPDILSALDLFDKPLRLIASLRR
jgi:P-type E1-E2 ATPase